jgi:hypothetical protein
MTNWEGQVQRSIEPLTNEVKPRLAAKPRGLPINQIINGGTIMITKRIFRALMITGIMIISSTIVEAQRINREALRKLSQGGEASPAVTAPMPESNRAMEPEEAAQEASQSGLLDILARQKKAIAGSWLDTVTVAGGATFKSLSTFTEDGGVIFTDQGDVITEPPSPHVFSAGQGVWVHQGGRTFGQTTLQLVSDLKGNLLGVFKLRATITLNESSDAYSAVWKAAFTNPAGNLIASFEGTIEGQRIKSEPLP